MTKATIVAVLLIGSIDCAGPPRAPTPERVIVRGRVIDRASERPIPGAQITIERTRLGNIALEDGVFTVSGDIMPGTYDLKIRSIGYHDENRRLIVTRGDTIRVGDIRLRDIRLNTAGPPAITHMSYGPWTLHLMASRVIPVGDTVWFLVESWSCDSSGAWCKAAPIMDIDSAAWRSVPEGAVIAVSGEDLVASKPGDARLYVTIGDTTAVTDISVIPPVASLEWEPRITRASVGDTVRLKAVARDSSGNVIAVLPPSQVRGRSGGPPASEVISAGPRGTALILHHPDVITLIAEVGRHVAEIQVTVEERR